MHCTFNTPLVCNPNKLNDIWTKYTFLPALLPYSKEQSYNFYCCTVQYGIYILFTHQQMHFLLNLEKFKFT